jgi:hypothetical protein
MLTACNQAQVDLVLSDADLIWQTANSLSIAIGAVSPADAASISVLTSVAISGINVIKADYDTYEADKTASNLQNVQVAIQAVQTNLPQELAALHIVDVTAASKVTAWVSLVTSLLTTILSTIGAVATPEGVGQEHVAGMIPTPESLKIRWLNEVCSGDAVCGNLVKVNHKHLRRKL